VISLIGNPPLVSDRVEDTLKKAWAGAGAGRTSMPEPSRILVVEQEPLVREVLVHTLEDVGYRVEGCPDGQAGRECCQGKTFDLIVTDRSMRPLPTHELVRRLREIDPRLPVIQLDASHHFPRDSNFPADTLTLYKPFRSDTLLAAVQEATCR
jgi:CheY-like chemotaxis protein